MGVRVDCRELKEFAEKIEKLNGQQREQFFQTAVKMMASRLLALVIPATPVGKVHGGTLRRGWLTNTANQAARGSGTDFSQNDFSNRVGALNIERTKRGYYSITITNPVKYASYVEYGHRQTPGRYVPAIGKRLKASWVNGRFFLRTSSEQLKAAAPTILQPLLEAYLRQVF